MFRISTVLAVLLSTAMGAQSAHWARQYFYDDNEDDLTINDLQFSSAQRGMAVGFLAPRDHTGKSKPVVLLTSDGGAHWSMIRTKEAGMSLFLLDDSVGWMVTENAIWQTVEAGRSWTRLHKLKDIRQVYFLDRNHGFAVGAKKSVYETKDGGKHWSEVDAAKKPKANPDYTSYDAIDFADAKHGLIAGGSTPPRHDFALPDWVDPSHVELRREWPTLSIVLETRNAGETWSASTAPLLGRCARICLTPDLWGLSLFEFEHAFKWPSVVYAINLRTGKTVESFHEKDRVVTDVALFAGKRAFLAGIEPPGKMPNLPIPGKVKILQTGDLQNWRNMDVDYRAVATRVILAPVDPTHIWAATDTGMILKMVD